MGPYTPEIESNPNVRFIKPYRIEKSKDWEGEETTYHYDKETTPEGRIVRRNSHVIIRPKPRGCTLHDSRIHPRDPLSWVHHL
jgi:hypothetical protein